MTSVIAGDALFDSDSVMSSQPATLYVVKFAVCGLHNENKALQRASMSLPKSKTFLVCAIHPTLKKRKEIKAVHLRKNKLGYGQNSWRHDI